MKLGITGTRKGMTESQFNEIMQFLKTLDNVTELHHGDFVGVDEEMVYIANEFGWKVICHPPSKSDLRAFTAYDEIREPKHYCQRDRAIVDECDLLIAVPLEATRQPKGGTWYTYGYALKKNKSTKLFPGEKSA